MLRRSADCPICRVADCIVGSPDRHEVLSIQIEQKWGSRLGNLRYDLNVSMLLWSSIPLPEDLNIPKRLSTRSSCWTKPGNFLVSSNSLLAIDALKTGSLIQEARRIGIIGQGLLRLDSNMVGPESRNDPTALHLLQQTFQESGATRCRHYQGQTPIEQLTMFFKTRPNLRRVRTDSQGLHSPLHENHTKPDMLGPSRRFVTQSESGATKPRLIVPSAPTTYS